MKGCVEGAGLLTSAAAAAGTEIHELLEEYLEDFDAQEYSDHEAHKYVVPVKHELDCIKSLGCDRRYETTFASPRLGYAGTVDLHSDETGSVVDFKTQDGNRFRAYPEWILQLVAYQELVADHYGHDPDYEGWTFNSPSVSNVMIHRRAECDGYAEVATQHWSDSEVAIARVKWRAIRDFFLADLNIP